VHHGYLREELPRLDFMTRKVAAVHGDHEPRLLEVRRVFEVVQRGDDRAHAGGGSNDFPGDPHSWNPTARATNHARAAKLNGVFAKLESEHENAGAALVAVQGVDGQLHAAGLGLQHLPRALRRPRQLEKNTHQHVHKENNVLFPRALAMGGAA
jgi:regulator of cell morphogenesis and NO signaling